MQRASIRLFEPPDRTRRSADRRSRLNDRMPTTPTGPIAAVPSVGECLGAHAIAWHHVWRGAHTLSGYSVAKNLLLVEGDRHAQALVSQGRQVDIDALNRLFGRGFRLGGMADVMRLYPGLPPQTLWPAGLAAGVELFIDDALLGLDEVAFDTRDPRCLAVIGGEDFRRLFRQASQGSISRSF